MRPIVVFLGTTMWLTVFGCALWQGGANSPSAADIANYDVEQQNCVANASTREAADTCRHASRARFCAAHPASVNCGNDASLEADHVDGE